MKLIANHTIEGAKTIRARDTKVPKDQGEYDRKTAAPGEEFDTTEFGISDTEAKALIEAGAASRKMVPADEKAKG